MSSTYKKLIAVIGATGHQGGAVVRALQGAGEFRVRALTRNPDKHRDVADEVIEADLNRPETLQPAFAGAHGAFVETDPWAGRSHSIRLGGQCTWATFANSAPSSPEHSRSRIRQATASI